MKILTLGRVSCRVGWSHEAIDPSTRYKQEQIKLPHCSCGRSTSVYEVGWETVDSGTVEKEGVGIRRRTMKTRTKLEYLTY